MVLRFLVVPASGMSPYLITLIHKLVSDDPLLRNTCDLDRATLIRCHLAKYEPLPKSVGATLSQLSDPRSGDNPQRSVSTTDFLCIF